MLSFNITKSTAGLDIVCAQGTATTSATPLVSQSGTTTSGNDTIACPNTTGLATPQVVRVSGATQKFIHVVRTVTTNTSVRLWGNHRTTASEAVTINVMSEIPLYFDMPFRGAAVEWINETAGITWTWREGMPQGNVYKRVWATGVQTLETGAGLVLFTNKLCVASDVAPPSSVFRFKIES